MRNLLVDFMNRKQRALPNNPERKLEKTALGLNNIKESPMSRVALNFWGKENVQIQNPQSKSRFLWFQEIQDPVQNLTMRDGGMVSVPSGVWTMAGIPQNLSSSLPVKSYIDDQLKESLNKWIEAKKSERRARDKAKEEAKKLQQEKIEKSKRSYQFWTLIQMANESWGDLSRMDTIDKKTANEYFPDLYNDSKGFRNLKTNLEKVFAGEKEYGELLAAYAENKPWYIDDWYTKEEKQWLKQGGRRSETLQNKPLWGKIGDALDSINIVWKGWEELDNLVQKIPTANSFLKMENRETKLQNRVKELSEEERWALEDKYETSPLLKTLYGNFDNYLKATQRTFGDELFDVWYTGVGPNLGKMFANIPSSTVKTITATGRWITNPADTVAGIGQMLLTEEGRSAMKDRYRGDLDKTIEEDPIGTASDALTVAELGAKGVSGGLKVSGLTKNAKIWAVSQKVADFGKTAWEVADLGLGKLYWKGMERLRDVQKNGNNILLKAGATYLRSTQEPLKVASEWLNAGVNKLIGLDKRTKQALENNPFVWKYFEKTKEYIEENGLSPESKKEINTEHIRGLSSEILDMIENKKDALRDTGELYEKIKNANVKFESTGVKEKLNSYLEEHGIRIIDWKLDFSDSVIVKEGDMKAIEKAYDRATREGYQAKVGLNQRKKMDKIAYPDGAPSAWTEIIRGMRSIFDENMKEKIPGLKEADKLYSEKIKELEQIEDGLIYKQGNRKGQLRDNFEQIVNTLDWPNRARMLQRLDELRPGLGDEIKAVHMMGKLTDMYFKTPTKLSGYLTNAAGIVWGGAIGSRYGIGGMIVGAISGWLVKQGATKLSQNAIRKAIDNVAPSSLARLKEIEAKIQAGKGMSPEERMLIDQIGEKILQESELLNNTRNKEQALSAPKIENKEIIEIDKRPRNILWGKLVKNEKKSGGNVSNSTLDGWSITKKTEIARKNGLDVDEKWDPYYKRTNGETIKYSSDGRRKRDYERDGFTHAYEFPLKPEYKKYVKELQKVRDGVKDSTTLTKMPGTLFDDKVAKDLTIDTKIYEKSFKKHGVIDTANLLTTANEYEYAIKMDDGSHFNLLKKIPNSDKYLLIGADLNKNTNGKDMYVLTYYEPTNSLKEVLDKSISKEREIFQRNGDIVGGFLTRNNNFKLIKEWELITPEKSKWKNILVPFMNKSPKWGEKYQVVQSWIYEEAKKYKTAEDFMASKWELLYHGSPNKFDTFSKDKIWTITDQWILGKWFYFANKEYFAKGFAKWENWNIIKVRINSDKLFDINSLKTTEQASKMFQMDENAFYRTSDGKIIPKNFKYALKFGEKLQEMGFDGAYLNRNADLKETVIFNPEVIQTEKELLKIRNEAQSEKKSNILWNLPEPKREAFETLPSDVGFLEESKKAWPKRIAPDRKAHQQLDPQTALEKLAEQEKTRLTWKIKGLKEDLATLDKLVKEYGQKMPARTEKNRQKYPDLIKDYGLLQSLKKKYQTNSINDTRDIIENIISLNTRSLEGTTPEAMKKAYIALVQEDISKGYKYPEAVLDFVPEARKILNGRERYEKGLYTSFSAKDERINYEYKEKLGAGMKRQDGKELTQEQKQDIVDGVEDFWDILGLNMKKLWEEKNWVYVHLNGKNVFLKNGVAGLYREKGENISISVGGTESVRQTIGGEVWAVKIHTTMAHELGHALDGIQNWKLFPSSKLFDLKIKMNKAPNWNTRYWKSDSEVTARAIEQYVAIKKGNTDYYDKPAYWKKEAYESIIEPMVKEEIREKFEGYMKWGEHSKSLPKTTQDSENAMIWVSDKTSKKMHELSEKYPSAGKNELDKIGKLNSGIKKSSGKRSEKDKEIYRVKDDILLDDIIEKGISIKDEWENTTYTLEQDGVYVTWHLWDRVRRILKQKWLLK